MFLAGILLFGIGVTSAFWGYKLRALFRFIPGLWAGALIGGATGFALTMGPIGAVIGAVLFGIICAVISSASEKTGVFLNFSPMVMRRSYQLLSYRVLFLWR